MKKKKQKTPPQYSNVLHGFETISTFFSEETNDLREKTRINSIPEARDTLDERSDIWLLFFVFLLF